MSCLEKVNSFLRPLFRWYVNHAYAKQLRLRMRAAPGMYTPRPPAAELLHFELWAPLKQPVPIGWYRFFANLSGIDDPRYVPDNIYHSVIEKILNDINYAWVFADKNFYERHFPGGFFPGPIIRNVAGTFLDDEYRVISESRAREKFNAIKSDLVAKPAIDSTSGDEVRLITAANNQRFCDGKMISWDDFRKIYKKNFLIQEVVIQHRDLALINPTSVNTLRVFTYRSVSSDKVHVMEVSLRVGRGGSFVDNANAGGIICGINLKTAATSHGIGICRIMHEMHPDSGVPLAGRRIPALAEVCALCRKVAGAVYSHRTLSFDVAVRDDGRPIILEINTFGQSAWLPQLFNPPLFGDMTSEVIDYCARNMAADTFKILRSFG